MSELDELLQPTVAPAAKRRLPWNLTSQFWVAFFGGIAAITIIAFFNARRLGASARKQLWIVLGGIIATAVFIASTEFLESTRIIRTGGQVLAVVLYLIDARIVRDEDGRHQIFGSGQYAKLWIPGILASLLSIAILIFILATVRVLR